MRFSLSFFVVAVMLSGCGGAQNQVGTMPGGTVQVDARSQMLPGSSSALIYATGGCGGTCVISYPGGQLVGNLNVGDGGACSDSSGNVYIPNESKLFEYAHGGTTPIETFSVSSGIVAGCSIDPTTNDVAVTVGATGEYNVAIFKSGSSTPATYLANLDAQFCGYDNAGNLFVDGYGNGTDFVLYELRLGADNFTKVKIRRQFDIAPGEVQWDGQYVAIEGLGISRGVTVYRLKVSGSRAAVTGKTTFKRVTATAQQSWIENNNIFIPYGTRGHGAQRHKIGVWRYPEGGELQQNLTNDATANFQGVAFSPGSSPADAR